MNYSMLSAAVVVALALSACEKRETVIQQPARAPSSAPAPEVVPVPVPGPQGPSGAPGAEGPKGEPGRPAGGTVVVVPPSPSDDKK